MDKNFDNISFEKMTVIRNILYTKQIWYSIKSNANC